MDKNNGKREKHYLFGLTDHQMTQLRPVLDEMDRNARAYGWEIGHGTPMTDVIEFSEDNPFLDPNWRDNVRKFDDEYNQVTLRGEPGSLVDLISKPNPESIIKSGTSAPPVGGDRESWEWEDTLGGRRSREDDHSPGLLHEEGSTE